MLVQILSHRGLWSKENEKNTLKSFEESFKLGFGIETDIRDLNENLVISHDMPNSNSIKAKTLFKLYQNFKNPTLALNIKADGLQKPLKELLEQYQISNYFVFDMSVPDALLYLKENFIVFTRQSEFEKIPSFYGESKGLWLDEFRTHWINEEVILRHLDNNKQIAIVSPDLHKKETTREWSEYKEIILKHKLEGKIMLCTDKVKEALEFFKN